MSINELKMAVCKVDIRRTDGKECIDYCREIIRSIDGNIFIVYENNNSFFKINFYGTTWQRFKEHVLVKVVIEDGEFIIDAVHPNVVIPIKKYMAELQRLNMGLNFSLKNK